MLTINYLGNEFISDDSLAIELAEELKEKYNDSVKFKKIETFEQMVDMTESVYLDVSDGIKSAELITDINKFEDLHRTTAHDIDFGFFLKLNHKLERIKNIQVIVIPKKRYPNIVKDVCIIINKLLDI